MKCIEILPIEDFETPRICKSCAIKNKYCLHDRLKRNCPLCKGPNLCSHNKRKDRCVDCVGKPHKCDICDKSFTRKDKLNTH